MDFGAKKLCRGEKNNMKTRTLSTTRGTIQFPAYIPVTTFGNKYPLDNLVRPYLPRLSQAMMVSFHYARQMNEKQRLPLFVDSGGFASLFEKSQVLTKKGLGILKTEFDGIKEILHPAEVLELQERIADVGFTLDFPIPPGMDTQKAKQRQKLTIANAHWAIANRRRKDLRLFAVVQSWDKESAKVCAREYQNAGFDGIAIGGMVPRSKNLGLVIEIIEAVRSEIGDLPIHVFGLGKPKTVEILYRAGVDSVDSSSYAKMAADGRLWGGNPENFQSDISPTQRLQLALCNLANATSATLPLTTSRLIFSTSPILD
jgi:tRNA-guanine family transglycosylase